MLAERVRIQVLMELHGTNQLISLSDENENTLVHSTAKFHEADCLSVRLLSSITYTSHSCIGCAVHCLWRNIY